MLLPQVKTLPTVVTVHVCIKTGDSQTDAQNFDKAHASARYRRKRLTACGFLPLQILCDFLSLLTSNQNSASKRFWEVKFPVYSCDTGKKLSKQKLHQARRTSFKRGKRPELSLNSIHWNEWREECNVPGENTGHLCFLTGFTQRKSRLLVSLTGGSFTNIEQDTH